jgi:uncharacterized repeat protein (TIGR03803 family)
MYRLRVWQMGIVLALCTTSVVAAAQTLNTLFDFDGSNGAAPEYMSFTQGADGSLYGTTTLGGDLTCERPYGCGTVFKITQDGVLTTLHVFEATDGSRPYSTLVQTATGDFYGTTSQAGASGYGTFFKISPSGELTTFHNFAGPPTEGSQPIGSLIQGVDGNFYGTTYGGGSNDYGLGTIFKITPNGDLTTLHSFDDGDGAFPIGGLVEATDGVFYGTTEAGGISGDYGTVFKITTDGTFTNLFTFDDDNGAEPQGTLLQATNGNFYGVTFDGGLGSNCPGRCGTIFALTQDGIVTSLYSFDYVDGANPVGGLIEGADRKLYGSTSGGVDNDKGTLFQLTPTEVLTTLAAFDGTDGAIPYGPMIQSTTGSFYGTTAGGGTNNYGSIFRLDMGLGPFVTFVHAAGRVGQTGGILGQGFIGTSSVSLNGTPATFTVISDTFLKATVPLGATTGYVTVTTPSGTLTSNVPFHVIP